MEKWARICLQKSSAKAETCAATFAKPNRQPIIPTTLLDLALGLTPLSMRQIGAVIAPLSPGQEREDVCNPIRLPG